MLTTLERYKTYYSIIGADKDSQIEMTIAQVTAEIESQCKRIFAQDNYTLKITGNGRDKLPLEQYPVTVATVEGITDFDIITESGQLYRSALWPKEKLNISYTAGYAEIPADLEGACITLVNIRMEMRGSEHLKTETVGPLRSEYLPEYPLYIQRIIDRYTRRDI